MKVSLCLGLLLATWAMPAAAAQSCGAPCGIGCPSTCYPQATRQSSKCSSSNNVETVCATTSGSQLSSCGNKCPAGYYVSALRENSTDCRVGYSSEQVDCRQVSGDFLSTCGVSCPTGYYVEALREDSSSCRNEFKNSRVDCRLAKGSAFSTCGTSCPAGYYVESLREDSSSCRNEFKNSRVNCRQVSGDFFSMCGTTCPAGYSVAALRSDPSNCSGDFKNNRVDCQKVGGGTLFQCGTSCPTGYYVNALKPDPIRCPNEFQNNKVECRQVSGSSLSTCGTSCPTGYYVNALKPDPIDCSGTLFKNNRVDCLQVNGDSFSMCGTTCPTGYSVSSLRPDSLNCSGEFKNSRVTCQKVSGGSFFQCGTSCPASYYVASLKSDPFNCPNELQNNEVECRQVTGGSFSTCGLTCPTGYYVNDLNPDPVNCSGTLFKNNKVDCRQVSGQSLSTCGLTCPTGYYVNALDSDPVDCPNEFKNNRVSCLKVNGGFLSTCGISCPEGYHVEALRSDPSDCPNEFKNNRVDCRLTNGDFSQCGTTCPTSYYVSALKPDASNCPNEFQNNRVSCGQANGPTLVACGSCPTGYFQVGVSFEPDCGGIYNNQASTCQSTPHQGPSIGTQPQSVTICAGQSATLTVTAQSAQAQSPLSYQWFIGKSPNQTQKITGATSPSLQVSPTSTTDYWVLVSNSQGQVPSATATVTVNQPAAIIAQPQPMTIEAGQPATLTVGATGTSLSYQWYAGQAGDTSHPVSGGTGPSAVVTPRTKTSYWVRVKNDCNSVDSSAVEVTVFCTGPSITRQPQPVSIQPGQPAVLTVGATGTLLSYQWYQGEAGDTSRPVSGTGSSLEVTPSSTTKYWVRVTNGCGDTIDSSAATVTVCTLPSITGQPQSVTIVSGQPATLAVTATGGPLSYQWYQGEVGDTSRSVPGGIGASVQVSPSETTKYWVRISNACGDTTDSSAATVTVCSPPAILGTGQPQSVSIAPDESATLTVTANGTSPSYQWYEGPVGVTSNPVPNGTGPSVTVTPSSTTTYWVRVTNDCGSADSNLATVTLISCEDPGSEGMACGGDGHHTCREDRCVCTDCASGVCCGASGNSSCDGQTYLDPNTGYTGLCTSTLPACTAANDFDGANTVYHDGEVMGCVKADGTYQWYPRRPSPRCQEVSEVCGFLCSTHYNNGSGFICDQNGVWNQNPPLPYCYDGTIPDGWSCELPPVCAAPHILTQPQSTTIQAGQSATLSTTASGTSPSFQWYRGNSGDTSNPLQNGLGDSIVVTPSTTTSYWVQAFNACGSENSQTATVTVSPICVPVSITTQPQSVTIAAGQSATLSVGVSGTSPFSYQWYRGAVGDTSHPVPNGTFASVTVTPSTTTSYWVRVSNACRTRDSQGATVTVEEDICVPPAVETQPQSTTIDQGDFAVLSVGASGTDLFYQWYEGTVFDTSNPVPGGNGETLMVSPSSTTSYWVQVANDCGTDNSSAATVNVNSCGPDGAACGGDGHHTCQGGQCVCSDCGSSVCCGAPGNTVCDGQQYFDPNTGYNGACTSSLPACGPGNDFDGDNEVYHDGDIYGCVKHNGAHEWFPRRPSPRCQEVAQVCDYLCAYNYNNGMGFQCEDNGFWSQNPPLPYCYGGTIPESFLCD